MATIESGKWTGPVPNRFDCMIASANQQVLDAPALLNQYPYQAWIARVQPAAPVAQVLAALVTGARARTPGLLRARAQRRYPLQACRELMAEQRYLDNEAKSVVIVMTSGPSTPHRCATPFYLGAILASMDADVRIYFTMEGVKLAQKGVPEHLTAMKGGKTIIEFMRDAKAAGVKLHLCKPAMPGYEMEVTDVIAEIDEISNASALADLIISCDRTLVF